MASIIENQKKLSTIFQELKSAFDEKLNILNLYIQKKQQWNKSAFTKFKSKFLKKLKLESKKEKTEEKIIKSLIGEISDSIKNELSKNLKDKELKYSELKSLIALMHQTKALIVLNIKQLKVLNEIGDNGVKFDKNKEKLLNLIREESKIIEKEKSLNMVIKNNNIPSFKWEYTVVGYGSLMNSEQVAGELCAVSNDIKKQYKKNPEETMRERLVPVLVFGWKRVFFRRATSPKWTLPRNIRRKALAAMDLEASHRHYFNAVAIKVSKQELEQLYKREIDYKLTKLKHVKSFITGKDMPNCICFKSPIVPQIEKENASLEDDLRKDNSYLGKAKYEGVQFHASKFIKEGSITPPPKYFRVCVDGAKGLDSLLGTHGMYESFLNTTFLYYIDRVLNNDKKIVKYKYYGQFTVREFLKLGYKLKGAHVLPIQYR